MATAAPTQSLPLFYNALEPLNLDQHGKMKVRGLTGLPELGRTHAVPLTVDEFTLVQRHFPIVFSVGGTPVPIALMGLNEGVNVFLDENGRSTDPNLYIPAYLRRYPFLLAKLRPDVDELSLCFDPTSGAVGDFEEGEPLFDGDQPSAATKAILEFCEQFEAAGLRTNAFVEDLVKSDLLMDGEVAIQPEGADQPFVYRGFHGRRGKGPQPARRRAPQDEPERHAAAHLRAPLLVEPNARRVRAAGAAGQGTEPHSAAVAGDGLAPRAGEPSRE